MKRFCLVILLFISSFSFAQNDMAKSWDENIFEPKEPLEDSYSPFEMLDQKKRYDESDSLQNNFDIAEIGSENIEKDNIPIANVGSKDNKKLPKEGRFYNTAKLVVINKITARSQELNIRVGDSEYFGNIKIKIEKCWFNNDLYHPSNKVLALVTKHMDEDDPQVVYHGWLISSNLPATNIPDSTYEVIARNCYDRDTK